MADKITEFQTDQIAEIVNIGAGNAATALSHMVGKKVDMTVPDVFVGSIEEVYKGIGMVEKIVMNIFLKLTGDVEGAMLMIYGESDAIQLSNIVTQNQRKSVKEFDDTDISALKEVGNILLGASVTALGKFLDVNILHSVPDFALDMLGASLDEVLVEMSHEDGQILVFRVALTIEEGSVEGDLYFIFDPKSTQSILAKTQAKIN